MACTVRVTPFVDGVAQTATDVALEEEEERVSRALEIALTQALDLDDEEHARFYLRGTWFSVQLEVLVPESIASPELVAGLDVGDLIFDQVELEFELVRETKVAVV
jgi:hypothetical protein